MWEFWIDVGGTFTDCLAVSPEREILPRKFLSSGVTKGRVSEILGPSRFDDAARVNDCPGFWTGSLLRFPDEGGATEICVTDFDPVHGFVTNRPIPQSLRTGSAYELITGEVAPLIAIRSILGLRPDQTFPPVRVRLGTTRGTNALLTRTGARTAFVTTRGFADILRIANQDRPRLFDLAIHKPDPLYETVVEIDARVAASGQVLEELNENEVHEALVQLRQLEIESIAICLMHAFAHPDHEQRVAAIARRVGFRNVSLSSQTSPQIKIVPRGETTVVDAYLNPVLRDYVDSIQSALGPQSQLRLMTSAGGLSSTANFTGKDSILSGPAGGVIGFSTVARAAGFERSIGFDMGGTSTDVARFDGRYDYEFSGSKAGVRIAAPMMAIETVAAGGGSRCEFDGIKLTVGPASAGAFPGPACYGNDGPLTVTDLNLYLGKLQPDRFPFPLDRAAVERKLQNLCAILECSGPKIRYTAHQLAEGFLQIANANMVKPIRLISVARGYDPRDYVLVAFGSAAGQHACAVARELGIRQVLSHPYAGLLSAFGAGCADIRRQAEKPVMKTSSSVTREELDAVFAELERQCCAEMAVDGFASVADWNSTRSLDLRYVGTDAPLNLLVPEREEIFTQFTNRHRELFGYTHPDRAVEIVTARVEVVIAQTRSIAKSTAVASRIPTRHSTTTTWFAGKPQTTDVYLREQLQPGDGMAGPAIICEATSTLVIDPGFEGNVLSEGEILISWQEPDVQKSTTASCHVSDLSVADPIQLEIFNNHFASIAEQMGRTLQRTAISTNVKERLDFSCALFSPDGGLVVNAPHIPVHLGAMSETVRGILQDNPDLQPGDVFVTNDPYRGGSHLPDVTVVTPVHHDDSGELIFWTACRAHHAEIGGISPGSMPPFSHRLIEEGVLIRNFKLIDRGRSREAELRALLLAGPYPTRAIRDNMADLTAQVAANQQGANLLRQLIRQRSLPIVSAYMQHIQAAAEQKTRDAIRRIPNGMYRFTDHLDDGSPLTVCIRIHDGTAHLDFTGTGPVLDGNLNANRSIVTAAVMYVFRCLIAEEIPLNSGVLAPITIDLPTCFLNPPVHQDPAQCAAIVGGNVETSQRIVDVLLGALGIAAASQGTMNNLTFGDQTFGYYETVCGGSGATENFPGADAVHTHMTNTRLTDPEVLEWRYPIRLHEFCIRRDSGGPGRQRGGDGIVRRFEFLKPLRVSILSERRGPYAPFGVKGGRPGQFGFNSLLRSNDDVSESIGAKSEFDAGPGDQLTIETPGGGGYGATLNEMRDATIESRLRYDLRER